ncbi:MAG: type II toxin-antitoxin system HicA family toxin [Alphaproteobacteria bacterium]|nr:type II toxin-antitoxin system HicA family toxin [Alphaproteobacteria bacterium]
MPKRPRYGKYNPGGVRFNDILKVLANDGFIENRSQRRGSHFRFEHRDGRRVEVVKPHAGRQGYSDWSFSKMAREIDIGKTELYKRCMEV